MIPGFDIESLWRICYFFDLPMTWRQHYQVNETQHEIGQVLVHRPDFRNQFLPRSETPNECVLPHPSAPARATTATPDAEGHQPFHFKVEMFSPRRFNESLGGR
jgi:hypothetical protein